MQFISNKFKKKHVVLMLVGMVLLSIIISCTIYWNDYYKADKEAVDAFGNGYNVSKQVYEEMGVVYISDQAETGLIFYPGGKVDTMAYEPLMETLASEGIMCVLLEMPFHLAVFDVDAAEGIQEQFPNIKNWYIGGHSLGGSMAAVHLSKNIERFEGLVLLGSYSTSDLSDTSLAVLSIYGSEDRVLNAKKYEENLKNLPEDFVEIIIEGGCHAYFGMYGVQDGDGEPTISNEEQILLTGKEIYDFIMQNRQ